jgi:hypothetical protein
MPALPKILKNTLAIGLTSGAAVFILFFAISGSFLVGSVQARNDETCTLNVNVGFGYFLIDTSDFTIRVTQPLGEFEAGEYKPPGPHDDGPHPAERVKLAPILTWAPCVPSGPQPTGFSISETGPAGQEQAPTGRLDLSRDERSSNDAIPIIPVIAVSGALCVITFGVTGFILRYALDRSDMVMLILIAIDILACVVIFEFFVYMLDLWIGVPLVPWESGIGATEFFWDLWERRFPEPYAGYVIPAALLFVVYLPTLFYLFIIALLVVMLIAFRSVPMYVLEKSTEAQGKTFFGHIGVSIGLGVTLLKLVVEFGKI